MVPARPTADQGFPDLEPFPPSKPLAFPRIRISPPTARTQKQELSPPVSSRGCLHMQRVEMDAMMLEIRRAGENIRSHHALASSVRWF